MMAPMSYYCTFVRKGVMPSNQVIGVLNVSDAPAPADTIGLALCRGHDDMGQAEFLLIVQDKTLPGRWHLSDGEFVAVGQTFPAPGRKVGCTELQTYQDPPSPQARARARVKKS